LDAATLEKSLQEILKRHDALRTRLITRNGNLFQEILPQLEFMLNTLDMSKTSKAQREEEVLKEARTEAQRIFDLEQGPLFRATLLRLGQQEHVLLITMHHIVSDGWSMSVLLSELITLYSALSRGQPSPLLPLTMQYADFAEQQRQRLTGETLQKQLSYWQKQLSNLPSPLELPTDHPVPGVPTFRGNMYRFLIDSDLTAKLRILARQNRASMFMLLLAAWQVLLHRYSGQPDILVGTAVANRNRLQLEQLIGFFVNTLVLRVDLSGDPDFSEVLGRVREASLGAQEHPDLPFEKLVTELAPQQKSNENSFFRVMFNWLNLPVSRMELAGLQWEHLEQTITVNRFDLMLTIFEGKDELPGLFEYSADLFDRSTIARFAGHLKTLLASIVANPKQKISALQYITSEELKHLLGDWTGIATEYPRNSTVCELFEQQAEQTPEAVALIFEDQKLSYRELNCKANQLARFLQRDGIQIEDRIAISMEHSAEMIIALLGVLKSGAVYVALDPMYPRDRISFILEATKARFIITREELKDNLPEALATMALCIDRDWPIIEQLSSSNLGIRIYADDLAYIVYTSGSTGTPKGVAITHRAIIRLVRGNSYARLGPQETFLQFAPVAFDASTFEIWGCLLNGGRLVIAPTGADGLERLGKVFRQQQITTAWLTAGLFHWMVEHHLDELRCVPQLLAGGDVLLPSHVFKLLAAAGEGAVLINGYGPTENTTFTCCHTIRQDDRFVASVPVGTPIANARVYVLDPQMQPVPVGVPGELLIGGDGLARGYWEAADLTAERFVPDPYSCQPGERLYRSGDRMRWLPGGILEFLGRIDNQVKIRGYRVELGEIESALNSHSQVREAVVIPAVSSSREKFLAAYFSTTANNQVTPEELRQYLRARLPDYMVPSVLISMREFPLTANGKVDRKALAALPVSEVPEASLTPPRTAAETIIAQIWREVLGRTAIGVEDDFFELGGHSLQATQITLRLRDAFQVSEFPLRQLFESPTIAGLVSALEKHYDPETLEAIAQALLEIQTLNPEKIEELSS
jgi:amino acid adenylation domain-containing protein